MIIIISYVIVGVGTSYFQQRYTDFGHTNSGLPKFNLKSYLNYQREQLQFFRVYW